MRGWVQYRCPRQALQVLWVAGSCDFDNLLPWTAPSKSCTLFWKTQQDGHPLLITHLPPLASICISQKVGVFVILLLSQRRLGNLTVFSWQCKLKVVFCTFLSDKGCTFSVIHLLRGTADIVWIFRLSDAYLPPSLPQIKQKFCFVSKNDHLQRSLISFYRKSWRQNWTQFDCPTILTLPIAYQCSKSLAI